MVRRTLSLKTLQTVEAMHTRMQATGAGPLAQPTDPPCVGTPKENDGQTGARAWTRQCCKGGGGGVGTRPWWLALFACGGAYWPRHPMTFTWGSLDIGEALDTVICGFDRFT